MSETKQNPKKPFPFESLTDAQLEEFSSKLAAGEAFFLTKDNQEFQYSLYRLCLSGIQATYDIPEGEYGVLGHWDKPSVITLLRKDEALKLFELAQKKALKIQEILKGG